MKSVTLSLTTMVVFLGIVNSTNADEAISQQTVRVHPLTTSDSYGKWVAHGKLIIQTVDCNGGAMYSMAYKARAGNWILLNNDVGAINDFFLNEITNKKLALKFLNDTMADWLSYCMGGSHGGLIISRRYLYAFKSALDPKYVTRLGLPPPSGETKKNLLALQAYVSNPTPIIQGNNWTLKFNVIAGEKDVEQWQFTGKLYPLQIRSFSREILDSAGTISGIGYSE